MSEFRIGTGFDVHRLIEGRELILGGLIIPFEKGLDGHSDADVLLHAITDSLLGALALGDIGSWFPDTDNQNKDIDSKILLDKVWQHVQSRGWRLANVDCTVIAQAPKLRPFIDAIRESISSLLKVELDRVSVKATTTEKLGFTGRGEGMAAEATVLISKS